MERYQTRYTTIEVVQGGVMRGVYAWMGGGLLLTALVSLMTASSPALLQAILGNRIVFDALVLGELGLVITISGAINRISASTAGLLFLAYAALNGLTMSAIFIAYTASSIASTFVVSAGMFGAMSLYGYLTKSNLASWGNFLFMGLVGVVIASLVNIFLQSPMVSWVMSIGGVIVFTGLTAYDTQRIKNQGNAGRKGAIIGALTLYLDFINMFLFMLRLFGNRR